MVAQLTLPWRSLRPTPPSLPVQAGAFPKWLLPSNTQWSPCLGLVNPQSNHCPPTPCGQLQLQSYPSPTQHACSDLRRASQPAGRGDSPAHQHIHSSCNTTGGHRQPTWDPWSAWFWRPWGILCCLAPQDTSYTRPLLTRPADVTDVIQRKKKNRQNEKTGVYSE